MFYKTKSDYIRSNKNKKTLIIFFIYRLGNYLYYSNINKFLKKVLLIIMKVFQVIFVELPYGIEIPFEAKIGKGLRLVHLNGIVIHPNVEIGDNCTIYHQVTIGANEHKNNYNKVAKIGNECYIGAGAKILGDIVIGDKCKIGANAVLSKNLESGHTVIGINKIIFNKSERNNI